MKIRKNLTKLVLGTLALIGVSCTDGVENNLEYHFNGKINDEKVKFYENEDKSYNILKVTKKDGRKIEYWDYLNNDLKVDLVKIKKDGKTTIYRKTHPFREDVLQIAQKQFDAYLDTIKAINYQKALDNISK